MNRLFLLFFCLVIPLALLAQSSRYAKANPRLAAFLQQRETADAQHDSTLSQSAQSKAYSDGAQLVGALVSFNDAEALTEWLQARGYEVRTMLDNALTTSLPVDSLEALMQLNAVTAVSSMNYRTPLLDETRINANADVAINGTGLYAPYTGKGVIIGVIDQGFLYTHPAFRKADGSSRIIAAWETEASRSHTALTTSAAILRAGSDGISGASHGTHVLGIAAGGRQAINTNYYGIAPDADIVVVPCKNLEDSEVIDGINYIKKVAQQYGQPYVVNMSFGTLASFHNGKDQFATSLDNLSKNGAILVAAAGNDGGKKIHSRVDFTTSATTKWLYVRNTGNNMQLFIASQNTSKFTVNVYTYNTSSKQMDKRNSMWLASRSSSLGINTDPISKQPYAMLSINCSKVFGSTVNSNDCIALEITGSRGNSVDAWICDGYNTFGTPLDSDARFGITPNDSFCISSPADANSVIAVSSHAARRYWTNYEGKTYSLSTAQIDQHSSFASIGPQIGNTTPKPTVSASGGEVISAAYDNDGSYTGTSSAKARIAMQTTYDGKTHLYAVGSGTSMASPIVAGAVAIWLEASPDLTAEQVKDIIVRSSKHDAYTGTVPNATWGYGKLDVYEGLKESLLISSIPSLRNTTTPFSLQAYPDHWKVLLNNDEDEISARLVDLNGVEVWRYNARGMTRGQDFQVPLASLSKGVYVLKLSAANNSQSHKIVVR